MTAGKLAGKCEKLSNAPYFPVRFKSSLRTDRDIAYTCNDPKTMVKCCNFKELQHFIFLPLLIVSARFLPFRQQFGQ